MFKQGSPKMPSESGIFGERSKPTATRRFCDKQKQAGKLCLRSFPLVRAKHLCNNHCHIIPCAATKFHRLVQKVFCQCLRIHRHHIIDEILQNLCAFKAVGDAISEHKNKIAVLHNLFDDCRLGILHNPKRKRATKNFFNGFIVLNKTFRRTHFDKITRAIHCVKHANIQRIKHIIVVECPAIRYLSKKYSAELQICFRSPVILPVFV